MLALARRPRASEAAADAFREAMRLAGAQHARLTELRAAMALARVLRGAAARAVLQPVHAWFAEAGEIGTDVEEAAELLAQ